MKTYTPTYRVQFTSEGSPYVTEDSCFGFVLGCHPLGEMPGRSTPTAALIAAIEKSEAILGETRNQLADLMTLDGTAFNNGAIKLAAELKALGRLQSLRCASKNWVVPMIERDA